MTDIHNHKILILDFGSQYTQLIARRVREVGVFCEIFPHDVAADFIKDYQAKGIILSGGPESVYDSDAKAPEIVFELGVPILGICYGMQTMIMQHGGEVKGADRSEFGKAIINILNSTNNIFSNMEHEQLVWMSHSDKVTQTGEHFEIIASSINAPVAAVAHKTKPFYGVQFHPETTHTENGKQIIENFVINICGCDTLWNIENIIENDIKEIKQKVGSDKVILGLSGGVDSSVVAAILHEAIGDQLTCIFVDTGLLRLNEGDQVMQVFAQHMDINVIRINAKNRFLNALRGICDPEQKRKIIGKLFVDIFDEEAAKIENAKWLAQGTIYSDVIESAGNNQSKAHVIKSHHNVGGLPKEMKLKLLEPLRELFKDEVRKLGLGLGLPYNMLYRHPFPGPGLGVRILGEIKKEYVETLQKADAIFTEELYKHNLYHDISQAFGVFLPVKSVGVVGDQRRYEYVIALRAVVSIDFMTATWANLPYDFLSLVSNRIVNEVKQVSRVVYDVTGKPPGTIEWE
ncbi:MULTISPECIES: glutamine-hydrolyzing GMP synthase [Francisella]|uniref:GMP synthase [glutamine-hydrolyzing] n=1 Tax=Francisella opportunistica TaxID=2016517 RepID=A0A345JR64_9GAMM|nr:MULTISPECIES: glutamine-hydrolyzing GMP synthase [Francisella]APC91529.1 GMP synthase [glutamine-hydrolyzing], amidotransferase subunit / GMP synthase [glutamine-hydrolyzing], ATP pyrophosphatase subunit [Francisella sp. MA067296]AXH29810.1 glutamine-hydrolyzing GMP synthase [Francisella opportunistica]AXH31460.1 GMP synthase (glutamine-hydrolyzing) [Francisella opportunistica]AXH33106.1 GMP synthase (glutamine-hydrolyzing) [Francisella opportunistica]